MHGNQRVEAVQNGAQDGLREESPEQAEMARQGQRAKGSERHTLEVATQPPMKGTTLTGEDMVKARNVNKEAQSTTLAMRKRYAPGEAAKNGAKSPSAKCTKELRPVAAVGGQLTGGDLGCSTP